MWLHMYVFCIYKNSTSFTFRIFAWATMPSSILFCDFVKFQHQSFYIQKCSQMNIDRRFIYYKFDLFIQILIFVRFFIYIFLNCAFWHTVYWNSSHFYQFFDPIFLAKKSSDICFWKLTKYNAVSKSVSHR